LRQELGGAIVLGLEFLVAADIIRTVTIDPSLQGVAILALIVLIRTLFERRTSNRDRERMVVAAQSTIPIRSPKYLQLSDRARQFKNVFVRRAHRL